MKTSEMVKAAFALSVLALGFALGIFFLVVA
jgi:hypothetical protein